MVSYAFLPHPSSSCKYKRRERAMLNIQHSPRVQPLLVVFMDVIDQNVVCASVSSQAAGTSHNASPAVVIRSVDGIEGRDNKVNLSRVRLMNALIGRMRVIMKTKSREELLICASSLRATLHEINKLNQSTG